MENKIQCKKFLSLSLLFSCILFRLLLVVFFNFFPSNYYFRCVCPIYSSFIIMMMMMMMMNLFKVIRRILMVIRVESFIDKFTVMISHIKKIQTFFSKKRKISNSVIYCNYLMILIKLNINNGNLSSLPPSF